MDSCYSARQPEDSSHLAQCSTDSGHAASLSSYSSCLTGHSVQKLPEKCHTTWGKLSVYEFPTFALFPHVLSRVLEAENFSMIPITPLWSQKEWCSDLLAFLVEEPLELPMLWTLLVQLHVKKFHTGLKSLKVHAWKLSSNLSARQAFQIKLWNVSPMTSGNPQLVSIRERSQNSSVERTFIHVRPQL